MTWNNNNSSKAAAGGRKHGYHGGGSKKKSFQYNPPRGGPGVLWTCEPGKEVRCRREGLDVLQYYYSGSQESTTTTTSQQLDNDTSMQQQKSLVGKESDGEDAKADIKLSLEEEIAMLKNQNSKKNGRSDLPFREYETGCKGTVFMLYTGSSRSRQPEHGAVNGDADDEPLTKKPRIAADHAVEAAAEGTDDAKESEPAGAKNAVLNSFTWQVLPTVLSVFQDLIKEATAAASDASDGDNKHDEANMSSDQAATLSSHIPTSRFITRMIPIQATCFASIEEMQGTVATLLKEHCSDISSTQTFAIQIKRRCCDHLTSQNMIQAIAEQVVAHRSNWKVDLRQPDFTVIVETCKTLVGMSILPSSYLAVVRNFNLAEIRAKVGAATE